MKGALRYGVEVFVISSAKLHRGSGGLHLDALERVLGTKGIERVPILDGDARLGHPVVEPQRRRDSVGEGRTQTEASAAPARPPGRAVEYVRALATAETRARSVVEFIEEVVREGRSEMVAQWRDELEVACAIAINAYERVRGNGPSVAPEDDG